jgi:hypothetical protein
MRATNKFGLSMRKYPEVDSLFIKLQGPTPRAIEEAAQIAKTISAQHGSTGFTMAASKTEADALWKDRYVILRVVYSISNYVLINSDVAKTHCGLACRCSQTQSVGAQMFGMTQ